jgi:hypothetical protein
VDDILKQKLVWGSGPVAQLVEHRTFNAVVAGSIPARLTIVFNLSHHLQILSSSLK